MDRHEEHQLLAEWFDRVAACINESGYGATPFPDEIGFEYDPRGDDAGFEATFQACRTAAGVEPTMAPITATEAAALYRHYLVSAACLREHGVAVSDPPSEQQWVDDMLSSISTGVAPWTPFNDLATLHEKECPQPQLYDLDPTATGTP